MKCNPNDTVFPSAPMQNYEETLPVGGLTKREFFAAMALIRVSHFVIPNEAAKYCIAYADHLIEGLNENETK